MECTFRAGKFCGLFSCGLLKHMDVSTLFRTSCRNKSSFSKRVGRYNVALHFPNCCRLSRRSSTRLFVNRAGFCTDLKQGTNGKRK